MVQNDQLTEIIIGCAYRVAHVLGCGFLEKVYENALVLELRNRGMEVTQQTDIKLLFEGKIVGDYKADLLVQNQVLVELKTAKSLDDVHFAQCYNYLQATGHPTCLLINFRSPKIEIKRIVNKFIHGSNEV